MIPDRKYNRVAICIFILIGLLLTGGFIIPQPAGAQLTVSGKYGSKYRTEYIYKKKLGGENTLNVYYNNQNQRSNSTQDPTELDGFEVVVRMEASQNPWKVVFGGLAGSSESENQTKFFPALDEGDEAVKRVYSVAQGAVELKIYDLAGNATPSTIIFIEDIEPPNIDSLTVISSATSMILGASEVIDSTAGVEVVQFYMDADDEAHFIGEDETADASNGYSITVSRDMIPAGTTFLTLAIDKVGNESVKSAAANSVFARPYIYGASSDDHLGGSSAQTMAFGDINRDGYDDLIIGVPDV